jgi:phosphonate transport system substrate-binding protein
MQRVGVRGLLGRRAALCGVASIAWACSPHQRDPPPIAYSAQPATQLTQSRTFAVHPLHNPRRLDALFGPLISRLARKTGVPFTLEASRSYEAFERKLQLRQVDFALPNPYQVLKAMRVGYRVFAKMGDDEAFRGIVLVRRDSHLTGLASLKGQTIAFPAPTALAATLMPERALAAEGLLPGRDYQPLFVGSQESSIMTVYGGQVAAAATWPHPWNALALERPEVAAALEVLAETEPLVNIGVVARDDVPPALVEAVRQELLHLHEDPEGLAILSSLELSRFEPADDDTYTPVRSFLADYAMRVGPLP